MDYQFNSIAAAWAEVLAKGAAEGVEDIAAGDFASGEGIGAA
jgi:hypothetical protein